MDKPVVALTTKDISKMADDLQEWILNQVPENLREKLIADPTTSICLETVGLLAGVMLDRVTTAVVLDTLKEEPDNSQQFHEGYNIVHEESSAFLARQIILGLKVEPCGCSKHSIACLTEGMIMQ